MATDDPIRASDVDRDAVVGTLREAYTAGRLTIDEFDERMAAAYTSRTWGDLRDLTVDLPTQPALGSDLHGRDRRVDDSPRAALSASPPQPEAERDVEPAEEDGLSAQGGFPERAPRRRGRPVGMLIPAAVWLLIMAHGAGAAGIAFVVFAVVAMMAIMSLLRRR